MEQGFQGHENMQGNTIKEHEVGEVRNMQVLACWGGQVCMKRSEYMASTSTHPESTERGVRL